MDALARRGMRFTNVFPEGDAHRPGPQRDPQRPPPVPVPRLVRPPRPDLQAPGWEPLDHPDASFLSALRRAGWWTAYVTDNPFLGYAPPYGRFRNSVNRFVRTGGQIGGNHKVSSVPDDSCATGSTPRTTTPKIREQGRPLPGQQPPLGEPRQHLRRPRLPQRAPGAEPGGRAAAGRSRSWWTPTSRTSPGRRPRASSTAYGGWDGREPAMPTYGRAANWLGPRERGPRDRPDARPLRRRGDA